MTVNQPKPALEETAARIRNAIAALGLNYRQVAEELGLQDKGGASIHNWATGKHAPSPAHRERLAEILGLEVSDIIPEGWSTAGGVKTGPKKSGLTNEERLEIKRERDREYQRRAYRKNNPDARSYAGPAERAVALYTEAVVPGQPPLTPRAVPSRIEDVFTTAIRADGSMQVRLNLILPMIEGIALVQMLYAADALKSIRDTHNATT
jgi:transcriptional regulator with XRE-family HTH domain